MISKIRPVRGPGLQDGWSTIRPVGGPGLQFAWSGDRACRAGALVQAGEVGFELVEAMLEIRGLAFEGEEEVALVGVEFVSEGEIAGADAIASGVQLGVEFGAGVIESVS